MMVNNYRTNFLASAFVLFDDWDISLDPSSRSVSGINGMESLDVSESVSSLPWSGSSCIELCGWKMMYKSVEVA